MKTVINNIILPLDSCANDALEAAVKKSGIDKELITKVYINKSNNNSLQIMDEFKKKYDSLLNEEEKSFVKVELLDGTTKLGTVYFEKKWVEFE